ncbi:MAG: HAD-IIIA family hydrolase [Candidatus Omnitrophica bacterium]|nr:HAD-IIIA family hydrolase [Candidatus Omnitrophota bacterium]
MDNNLAEVKEKAAKIKVVIMDVDGVLTDGRIVYDIYGDELKFFDVADGLGVMLAQRAGLAAAIISARASRTITRRAKDMQVKLLFQNFPHKLKAYQRIMRRLRLTDKEICFIGDDLVDLGPMKRAGLAVAVENAASEVKQAAHYVTARRGGRGAVRETVELILKSQGKWDQILAVYNA